MNKVTELIKSLRNKMSQTEISRNTKINQTKLSRWESAGAPPAAEEALKLAALAASLDKKSRKAKVAA